MFLKGPPAQCGFFQLNSSFGPAATVNAVHAENARSMSDFIFKPIPPNRHLHRANFGNTHMPVPLRPCLEMESGINHYA